MGKIETFEDIPIWQEARSLVTAIYSQTNTGTFAADFGLRDQIQRASVSVMTNVAEGFERRSHKEFIQFLNYSKASSGEVRSLLYVALDLKYIDAPTFKDVHDKSLSLSKSIAGFIKYLKSLS